MSGADGKAREEKRFPSMEKFSATQKFHRFLILSFNINVISVKAFIVHLCLHALFVFYQSK